MVERLGVAIIGCGLIGSRRARAAAAHGRTHVAAVVDADRERARALAGEVGGAREQDWRSALERDDVAAAVIATPNGYLAEIGTAALRSGKHVLLEKPMGRNLEEARALAEAAETSGRILKIGFNHRYHPALARAKGLVDQGRIGRILHLRARYGHGSRPGCETEWRADPVLAGGGELTDQGIHLADLFHWFCGLPSRAVAFLQTAVWPVAPLEDNAFGLFRFPDGRVAQLHVSMTQWKNLFSLEIHGELGALAVEGLGGSYGTERLTFTRRRLEGGVPEVAEETFAGPDESWSLEWEDFARALDTGRLEHGGVADGLAAMRMVDALYRSAQCGTITDV